MHKSLLHFLHCTPQSGTKNPSEKLQINKSVNENKIIFLSVVDSIYRDDYGHRHQKTLQELRMLSSVTFICQVTKTVMNSCSQLSLSL